MSLEFYKTLAGRKYYEGTMPRIADALERIAEVMEKKTDSEFVQNAMSVDDALSEIESITRRAAEDAARESAESREYGG